MHGIEVVKLADWKNPLPNRKAIAAACSSGKFIFERALDYKTLQEIKLKNASSSIS